MRGTGVRKQKRLIRFQTTLSDKPNKLQFEVNDSENASIGKTLIPELPCQVLLPLIYCENVMGKIKAIEGLL